MARKRLSWPERIERFWSHVDKGPHPKGCWIWTASVTGSLGYGQFGIGNANMIRAHRFAWLLTRGKIPAGLGVLHECDNPRCVNPDHLWLGTSQQNVKDMDEKRRRRAPKGISHWQHKLDDEKVREIRKLYSTGKFSQRALANRYGVIQQLVSLVVRREGWRHVA